MGQEMLVPIQKDSLLNFLKEQGHVPGLGYYLTFPKSTQDTLKLGDFELLLVPSDSGKVSALLDDFEPVEELEKNTLTYGLVYSIYSETASDSAVVDYLSNLIRHGDYIPVDERRTPGEDLVSIAIKTPYAPVFGNEVTFTGDYKLFGVTTVILFFFFVALAMILIMIYLKAKKTKKERLEVEYDELIVMPLTTLMFEKDFKDLQEMKGEDFEEYFPKNLLKKPIYREVLIDRIIGLNKKMKGEFKGKLKTLYNKLGLDKVSVNKIRKKYQWHIVADGLVEINEMDLVEFLPDVKKHTNSSNFHVRSLAVAAMLNLSEKSDLAFLRDQTYPLSDWQQMNYLRIIKYVGQSKNLQIEALFTSANPSIRIFGFKLVRMLGRVDLLENLSKIASGLSDPEKVEILKTYQELGAHMEVQFINECLVSENSSLVRQAVRTARILGDEESVRLLLPLFQSSEDFKFRLLVMRSLAELDKAQFEQLTSTSEDSTLLAIRNHILDPKLAHV